MVITPPPLNFSDIHINVQTFLACYSVTQTVEVRRRLSIDSCGFVQVHGKCLTSKYGPMIEMQESENIYSLL